MCITQKIIYKCGHLGADTDVAVSAACELYLEMSPCGKSLRPGEERFSAPGLCSQCQSEMERAEVNDLYWLHRELEKAGPEGKDRLRRLVGKVQREAR